MPEDNGNIVVKKWWLTAFLVPTLIWYGYTVWWASALRRDVDSLQERFGRIEQFFIRDPFTEGGQR